MDVFNGQYRITYTAQIYMQKQQQDIIITITIIVVVESQRLR
jgi:hypothetical protein